MTIDQELRDAADELLTVVRRSPIPPMPEQAQLRVDLTMDHLWERDEFDAPRETKGRFGLVMTAAAVLLVVVGFVALANWNRRDEPTGPASAPAVTAPLTTPEVLDPVPAQVVDALGYRWSRIPHSEAVFGEGYEQMIDSVTVGGPGLVAVGQAGGAVAEAVVWTSVDGINWSRVLGHKAVFVEAPMSSVTAGGPGLVAVGVSFDEDGRGADAAAVWTSVDGLTWSRIPHDEAIFGGAPMTSVAVGGPGLVAVGWDGHPHGGENNAVVWTSPDGLTWSRVPHDEAIFGNGAGAWMWSVAAGSPGLVAVGTATDGAAVWTSPDGITWSRVPHDEAVFGDAVMRSVTAGGPGLVAVGEDWAANGAAVWTSVDGITWSRVPYDEAVFGGDMSAKFGNEHVSTAMQSVAATGSGLVAVGRDAMGAAAWTSVDGITWIRVPRDEAVFDAQPNPILEMRSIVAGGPGLVAVGTNRVGATYGATESNAAVWVATPEE